MFGRNRLGYYGVQGMGNVPMLPQQPNDPNEIRLTPSAQQAMANAPRKPEKQPSYWQGGDKFTFRDGLAGALSAIGDGFSTWANGPSAGGATNMLIGGRMSALQQAKAAQAAAQQAAAAEEMRQRQRQEGLVDYEAKKGIDAKFREPPAPDAFERTMRALNIDPASPEGQQIMRNRLDSMARDPNDEFVVVPIPGRGTYAGPRSGMPAAFGMGGNQNPAPRGLPPIGSTRPRANAQPLPQLQHNAQSQYFLDEAKKQEMLEEARNYGRGYMQRMGY